MPSSPQSSASHTANRRAVFGWVMYDFANSPFPTTILATVLPVYFVHLVPAEGLVFDLGLFRWQTSAPALWGYTVSFSMLVTAVLAPVLGAAADYSAARKRFLCFFWGMGWLFSCLLFLAGPGRWHLAMAFFVPANIGFAGSLVFYNAFLPQVAAPQRRDWISGLGFAAGYVSGGLLLAVNLAMIQKHSWFGIATQGMGTRLSFITVGLWWAVFAVPTLLYLKEAAATGARPATSEYVRQGFGRLRETFRHLRNHRELFKFLAAYLIYNDGIQTVISMASIFAAAELGLDMGTIILVFLMIQFVAVPGSLVFSRLAQRFGAKRTITFLLVMWVLALGYAFRIHTEGEFWVLGAVVGFILGPSQALSRSLFSRFVPPDRNAEFFGFFSVSQKFAAILGPFIYGLIHDLTGSARYSILFFVVFFAAGLVLLSGVNVARGMAESGQSEGDPPG